MTYITPNDEKCRLVKSDLRHYITTIVNSYKISKRKPHTYIVITENNSKRLKYVEFKPTIIETLQDFINIANKDNFVTFVGLEKIKILKYL